MLERSNASENMRVLVHAPYGRDGALIRTELQAAGFAAEVCTSIDGLCEAIGEGAGVVLIGDEVLTPTAVQRLAAELASQPPWSDLPLLVMTSGGASTAASRYRLALLEPIGNVTLLERPLRPATLISALRAALRARGRQYQLRDHLARIELSEQALRRSEARFRFLSELGDATRSVSDPGEVTAVVAQRLGEHLKVSRCAYATVKPDSERFTIVHDYAEPGCASTVGDYRLSPFGPRAVSDLRACRTLVINDVERELATGQGREAFLSLSVHAIICCPLVKNGKLAALMAVHQTTPRDWTQDDVDLVEEVGERCWVYIERERLVKEIAENNQVLQATNLDLTRVNRELEEFAFVASHDLQEPLRMVNIYTQLILKRLGGADETLACYGDFVRQGVNRMEDLLQDLLSFSRAVHAEKPKNGTADLSAALNEAISVLKNRIDENGAVIKADPLPIVRGDTGQLGHVFQNLISNSIKYSKTTETPEIHISVSRQNGDWVLAVRDNGIGFDQQYAERIFGLFKRLHRDEYPGTGLGLAICQRIVERYGGRMWARSNVGEGSTFYFALPAVEGSAVTETSGAHAAETQAYRDRPSAALPSAQSR